MEGRHGCAGRLLKLQALNGGLGHQAGQGHRSANPPTCADMSVACAKSELESGMAPEEADWPPHSFLTMRRERFLGRNIAFLLASGSVGSDLYSRAASSETTQRAITVIPFAAV